MSSYRVLALVSGGKDSCYNALLCEQQGHELVALGNLYPSDECVEELDSYMYQTVGHQLIEAYAECTGLPLLRKRIVGSSVEQGLIYSGKGRGGNGSASAARDEVEDLEVLLKYAQDRYDIEAVSSGAIASDYQRSRVERVCSKLKLVSLAYMWHQPQSQLMREMIVHGIDARLIKVAAAGLDPERHLGKSLRQMEGPLHKLRRLYGIMRR
jgi:diphthine-ammonia ligase